MIRVAHTSQPSSLAKYNQLAGPSNFRFLQSVKVYYRLTKPGIIYGNAITAAAGFFLASAGSLQFGTFVAMLLGTSAVIAAACVFNNYIDRGIDAKMERTKRRATVSGRVSGRAALLYGSSLGLIGFGLLAAFTNQLTVIVGLIGLVVYVAIYGYAKRHSIYGTEVGSIAGAMPIVAGYTAATNRFDSTALILFFILAFWQMPHFYAIAMYRLKDYQAAGIPVLPAIKGLRQTKLRMLFYTVAFGLTVCSLALFGHAGYVYLTVVAIASLAWLYQGLKATSDDIRWAKNMFGCSLIVLLAFSFAVSLNAWLP